MVHYVQVILPLRLWEPWYSVEGDVELGQRVCVSLGHKDYIGVVARISDKAEIDPAKIHPVKEAETGLENITEAELKLWHFIADYYLCTIGEVYKAAYPAAKTKSEQVDVRRARKHPRAEEKLDLRFGGAVTKPLLLWKQSRLQDYLEAASNTIKEGRSVLFLVPEMEFGDNLQEALSKAFGSRLKVYNSLKTPAQKRKVMNALREADGPEVILATRSALFLPFKDLGLVVVDEEHDPSYKQSEPAPRYHARDVAVVLAAFHGASCILGSAFPSLESIENSIQGKYALRREASPAPKIDIVDIGAERRKRGMRGDFSCALAREIEQAGGLVTVVRGYQSEEEVQSQVEGLFPGIDPQIITASSARKSICHSSLTAILQADSLFAQDDFRADEKVMQLLTMLLERTDHLVIQTYKSQHPVYQALLSGQDPVEALLAERKQFSLPPYTRLVDIKTTRGVLSQRLTLEKDKSLASRKKDIFRSYREMIIDVDPA